MNHSFVIVFACLLALASCSVPPTPTPDLVATRVAVEKAAFATLTAEAPTITPTDAPTDTPTATTTPSPTHTLAATNTPQSTATHVPTVTDTSTLTPTPSSEPTATLAPTATSSRTATPLPTETPENNPTTMPTVEATAEPTAQPTKKTRAGGTLLFASTELSQNDLYTIDEQGTNRKRLTDIGWIGRAKFSSDGERIVFERVESEKPVYNSDVYVMNADGSSVRNITQTTDWVEFDPDWSPDGTKIVFRGRLTVDTYSKVYIMNADGSGRTLLTDINNSNRYPSWSPDGKQIAFVSYLGGRWW